ncbi:MAG TPA: SDR family oxidoreductase [Bacilli bacterium]|nr:SDR family oxidoreductase [Bacilli bacterium]
MKALVTGASSGIGRDMARYLSNLGYDLILVARDKQKLEELQGELKTNIQLAIMDLSVEKSIKDLYLVTQKENIDVLINCAGFGSLGDYRSTDVFKETDMINVNIRAVHILTKMFLKDFEEKGSGHIINIASVAGLLPGGPLMSTYYATKSYVVSFSSAIYEELRRNKSNVKISVVCPGPVATNFDNVAGVKFSLNQISSKKVAKYAIDMALDKNKFMIIPGFDIKIVAFMSKFLSRKQLLKITYNSQKRKDRK